jgi:indole-3-glycerol phosphate synthase
MNNSGFEKFLTDFNDILPQTIIDFKAVSPLEGDLFCGQNPVEVAKTLEEAGILGLSVVTEPVHFGGSLKLLRDISKAVSLPILRKDFIKSEDDLLETVENGAKGVLLICAAISPENVVKFHEKSLELGLHPVVEVHNREEMELAKKIQADFKIIGINNKDISILEKDGGTVSTTRELMKHAPDFGKAFIISESGISGYADAKAALNCGANAVLIGTAFWKSINN